jgi:N-sulfoglucosamine sulfohydrolase
VQIGDLNKEDKMNRRKFLGQTTIALSSAAVFGSGLSCSKQNDRPNILWLTAEDMSPTLGCYGDEYAVTPHIDKLASEGIRYTQCYANAPLCTPARSSIITGIFASSLGTQHLRGEMPLSLEISGYPELLRRSGYYCTNNVKEDYNFQTPVGFWDDSSDTAHWRNNPDKRPFFSIFNFMTTHQSQTRKEGKEFDEVVASLDLHERHDPANAPLPPYYPDTPRIRKNIAAFYNQVTLMDQEVGDLISKLKEDGLWENTIIFFYSDHGSGLPRGKRWLHTTGLHVPLIVRCPEKYRHLLSVEPGATSNELISFVDFPATVLSLANVKPPKQWHGRAFLGKFKMKSPSNVFAIRDRVDEVLEMSRTTINGDFQYIRNFMPHRPRMQRSFFSEYTPIRQELRQLDRAGELSGDAAWLLEKSTPAEELYDIREDYLEMKNLADKSEHKDRLFSMHRQLIEWMKSTRDLSLLHENDMIERANGQMPYDFLHDDAVYPLEDILQVADMVGRGEVFLPQLRDALSHTDPAIRYWGATGLAALNVAAHPAKTELQTALDDEKSWVRFATAEACCYVGLEAEVVPVLIAGLEIDNIKENLHAAQILGAIGHHARPAILAMKRAIEKSQGLQDHGWYMRETLMHAVKELDG